MKTFFYLLLTLFTPLACVGQSDFYLAIYKTDVYPSNAPKDTTKYQDPMVQQMQQETSIHLEKVKLARKNIEYELYFDKTTSLYQQKEIMIPEGEELVYLGATMMGGGTPGTKFYKDIQAKVKIKHLESSGKLLNVVYPFEKYKWTITDESRMINGYKCYKATTSWEEFDYGRDRMLSFNPVVWFTNDVPFPFGPKGLDGLPGLVVEATINGKFYFYLSELKTLKKDKKKFLKAPTGGEAIDYIEFAKQVGAEFRSLPR